MPLSNYHRIYLAKVIRTVALAYLGIALLVYFFQSKIIFPAPPTADFAWDPAEHRAKEVWIQTQDGVQVQAWLFEHESPKATLIYSHGNAESICFLGDYMETLRDYWQVNVIAFDYRGYGKTEGKPSEAGLEQDATAVADWVSKNSPWNSVPIIAMGRSMGGFTANVMAAKLDLQGLILDRTFSSIEDVAAKRMPFLPIRLVLKHRMRSIDWIEDYHGPLLQMHGDADEVIPLAFGRKLFEACPSNDKEFLEFEFLSHNVPLPREFLDRCKTFIDRIANANRP